MPRHHDGMIHLRRRRRLIKKVKRFPAVVALLAAIVTFPPVLIFTVLAVALISLGGGEPGTTGEWVSIHGLGLIVAALSAKFVYSSLRWRAAVTDRPTCGECGHDLTGSLGGTCPECGRPVSHGSG